MYYIIKNSLEKQWINSCVNKWENITKQIGLQHYDEPYREWLEGLGLKPAKLDTTI